MRTIIYIFFIALATQFISSCGPGETKETPHAHEDEDEHGNENTITLMDVQIASAGVETGDFDSLNVSGFVKANGILDLPPQNIAAISAPMAGFVKKANYLVGDYVKKGATLAIMEHPDYLKIQEDYMVLQSRRDFLSSEWERQKVLDSANVNAKKRLQEAEAEYLASEARIKALEKQLIYLGLDPENVRNGHLNSKINIRAPFSGYITQLNTHNGLFVQPEQELYEMIDPHHMHLELSVFEKDISKIKVGQEISFKVPAIGEEKYEGEVYVVGRSFDAKNKTVRVHGHIHGDPLEFVRGYYVDAMIFTDDQKVRALPEEAIVRDEGKEYIFFLSEENEHEEDHDHGEGDHDHHDHGEKVFRRVEVSSGISKNGMKEIKETGSMPDEAKIVVKGAYDLHSEMKKGEGGHHHH